MRCNSAAFRTRHVAPRLILAALACTISVSCSKAAIRCERVGDAPEKAVRLALNKLIRVAQASTDPTIIHYRDEAQFREMNPDCCSIRIAKESIWSDDSGEITIFYRRQITGPEPFYLLRVAVGPCVDWMDESGSPLTEELYNIDRKSPRR